MALNEKIAEETFGERPVTRDLKGGKMPIFGHTVHRGEPMPERGTSPNVKTGFPVTHPKGK